MLLSDRPTYTIKHIKYKNMYKELESAGTGTPMLLQNQNTIVHMQCTQLASVVFFFMKLQLEINATRIHK